MERYPNEFAFSITRGGTPPAPPPWALDYLHALAEAIDWHLTCEFLWCDHCLPSAQKPHYWKRTSVPTAE